MTSQKVYNSLLGSYKVKATQTVDDENVTNASCGDERPVRSRWN